MAATVLRSIQTCDTPVVENRDDGGWRVVTHACGCSRTYGAYHGFGCRNLLSTTVCDTRVSVCRLPAQRLRMPSRRGHQRVTYRVHAMGFRET